MSINYKVKRIEFMKRKVPIMMQNENGPCPLLALANVMLLRNHISLPLTTENVSQERLISLVAERMLDANSEERLAQMNEDHAASLRQNISDAIHHVPKLTTGVDVNPKFTSIGAFEFTRDIAIFDLLDIRLVHGWLVDPQEKEVHGHIGNMSYNELIAELIAFTGQDAPIRQINSGLSFKGTEKSTNTSNTPTQQAASLDAEDSKTLQEALKLSLGISDYAERDPLSNDNTGTQNLSSSLPPSNNEILVQKPDEIYQPVRESKTEDNQSSQFDSEKPGPKSGREQEEEEFQRALELSKHETNNQNLRTNFRGNTVNKSPSPQDLAESMSRILAQGLSGNSQSINSECPAQEQSAITGKESSLRNSNPPAQNILQSPAQQNLEESSQARMDSFSKGDLPTNSHNNSIPRSLEDFSAENSHKRVQIDSNDQLESRERSGVALGIPVTNSNLTNDSGNANKGSLETFKDEGPSSSGIVGDVSSSERPYTDNEMLENNSDKDFSKDLERFDSATLAKGKMIAYANPPVSRSKADVSESIQAKQIENKSSEEHAKNLQRASLVQDFLERNSSQLTEHGIVCLHQGLRNNELGILFRNNHFTTIFFHNGAIWMLATDQGFLYEQDVIWERLIDVGGNNEFVGATFQHFKAHTPSLAYSTDAHGPQDSGGDMALALQLQEEENLRQQEFIAQQQRYNQQQANIPQTQPASNAPSKKEAKAEARDFRRRKGRQDPSASTNPKDGRGKQQNSKSKDERCCIQ